LKLHPLFRSPLAALVPPLVLSLCVWLWAVDVLNWDEWTIWMGMLEKLQDGTFALPDLFSQQNEQRNLAARLFGLALLPVSGLNRLPECLLNIVLAGAACLCAVSLYHRTMGEGTPKAPTLAFSLLAFSLLQWESFSVGINSSVLLPPLGMLAGAALVAGPALTWGRLTAMILMGVVPSFCFVNGLFYWLCLAPAVALSSREGRAAKTAVFLLVGAAMWVLYFYGYSAPGHHPSPLSSLLRPLQTIGYFLAYLGGALMGDKNLMPLAVLAGAAGLWLLWPPLRDALRDPGRFRTLAPWLGVAAFSLLSAGATALGRSGFGPAHALESRYASFSTPLWMTIAALCAMRWRAAPPGRSTRAVLACCLGLFLLGSVLSAVALRNRVPRLMAAREELFRLTDPRRLEAVFPDPAYVALKLPLLLERRLGPYRDIPLLAGAQVESAPAGGFSLRPKMGIEGRVCGHLLTGSAKGQAGAAVLLAVSGRAAAVGRLEADGSFALFVPAAALPEGDITLKAFVLRPDGRSFAPLAPMDPMDPMNPMNGLALANIHCPPPPLNVEKYFHVR